MVFLKLDVSFVKFSSINFLPSNQKKKKKFLSWSFFNIFILYAYEIPLYPFLVIRIDICKHSFLVKENLIMIHVKVVFYLREI